jgi:hypothetical protein
MREQTHQSSPLTELRDFVSEPAEYPLSDEVLIRTRHAFMKHYGAWISEEEFYEKQSIHEYFTLCQLITLDNKRTKEEMERRKR